MTVKELKQKLEDCDDELVVVLETAASIPEEAGSIIADKGKFRSVSGAILQDKIIILSPS